MKIAWLCRWSHSPSSPFLFVMFPLTLSLQPNYFVNKPANHIMCPTHSGLGGSEQKAAMFILCLGFLWKLEGGGT